MAHAVLRKFRQSPRKVRMVADMIRGRQVADAIAILDFQQRKAAKMLRKVLGSAVANATTIAFHSAMPTRFRSPRSP